MSLSLDTDVFFFRFFCSYYPSEQKLSFTYNNGGLSLLVFYAFNIDLKEGQSPKEYKKKREKKCHFHYFYRKRFFRTTMLLLLLSKWEI